MERIVANHFMRRLERCDMPVSELELRQLGLPDSVLQLLRSGWELDSRRRPSVEGMLQLLDLCLAEVQ
jgi:hypothetical protein